MILLAAALASTGLGPTTAAQTTDTDHQQAPFVAAVGAGTFLADATPGQTLRCMSQGPIEMTIVQNGTRDHFLAAYAFSHPCASHAGECEETSRWGQRIGFSCTAGQWLTVRVQEIDWAGALAGTAELRVSLSDALPFPNEDIKGDLLATVARDDAGLAALPASAGHVPSPLK